MCIYVFVQYILVININMQEYTHTHIQSHKYITMETQNFIKLLEYKLRTYSPSNEMLVTPFVFLFFNSQISVHLSV